MRSRRQAWGARLALVSVLALAFHALVGGVIYVWPELLWPPQQPLPPSMLSARTGAEGPDRPIEITTLVDELKRPDERSDEEKKKEEERKKEEENKKIDGQVVDIAKPILEQRPDKADFIAEYDSKVDKQTRGARGKGEAGAQQEMIPPPGAQGTQLGPLAPSEPVKASKGGRPGPLAMRDLPAPRAEHQGPAPTTNGDAERAGSSPQLRHPQRAAQSGEAGDGGERRSAAEARPAQIPGAPGMPRPDLKASREILDKAIGRGPGSMDYLKDVDEGEFTGLNAKKHRFASFFNRLKRQVGQEWHPDVVYLRHDRDGNVYGVKDRITVLVVVLSSDGHYESSSLLQSSGVGFLDDEAQVAFQRASFFPNPPRDLVEPDGKIDFRFAFIFELSGRNSFKVFKY